MSRKKADTPLPLSNAQKRLWLTEKLSGSRAPSTARVIRIYGELDYDVLEHSLREIHWRHETLRTSFIEREGVPYQVISPEVHVDLERRDLSLNTIGDKESEIQRIATESAYLNLDMSKCPLSSYRLIKIGVDDHVLAITIHHLVNDGWSWGVFGRELGQLYGDGLRGHETRLPPLPTRYQDYVRKEQRAEVEITRRGLNYWTSRLSGITPVELPTGSTFARSHSHHGSQQSIVLDPGLSQRVFEFAAREEFTPFTIFLTTLLVLLGRCSGQVDIVLGIILSGRSGHREIHDLIGYFINVLLLRTEVYGPFSFREMLSRVKTNIKEDFRWSELPFERLVEELNPDRAGDYNSLLHVLVNYKKSGMSHFNLQGLAVEPVHILNQPAHVPLQLNVEEEGEGIFVQFLYKRDMFSGARMAHFLSQYVHLLDQSLDAPERGTHLFSLITKDSGSMLPDPGVVLECVPYRSVITRFMKLAETHGEATAVEHRNKCCSYAELCDRAINLALILKENGYGNRKAVAVTGGRCIGLVVAIIAVMAGGGVALPIDPALPWKRRQLYLEKANASLMLTLGDVRETEKFWMEEKGMAIWNIDAETGQPNEIERKSELGDDLPEPDPGGPAYIFFTSGTTGEPAGVLGLHKGIDHFIDWEARQFGIGIGDRVAQLTHLSFDVLLRELYLPLATGGTVCIPSEHESVEVLRWLGRSKITVLHTVPTLANTWLTEVLEGEYDLSSLRWVFFSGESLSDSLVKRWREAFPECGKIVNFYGPTETTMVKSWYLLPPDLKPGTQPLGSPLPQTQLLVMNNEMQVCGIGEIGEIVIRTPYRTSGYIDSLNRNREKFILNPYTKNQDDFLYMTGDRGRYTVDCTIEFHGRMDAQFKISGTRVEPDEIARVMLQNEGVQACCVVPRKSKDGHSRIVAYIVGSHRLKPDTEKLRKFAQEYLPYALVPSIFHYIEKMPKLPNGKLDQQTLPEPEWAGRGRDYVAPRNSIENQLAEIWERVLGVSQIGINDNFLELGGHSLTAMQMISRANHAFEIDLPLSSAFDVSTLENLAYMVAKTRGG